MPKNPDEQIDDFARIALRAGMARAAMTLAALPRNWSAPLGCRRGLTRWNKSARPKKQSASRTAPHAPPTSG